MYHMTHKLSMQETSSHAWSRPLEDVLVVMAYGNISTCVEQTPAGLSARAMREKHLHMRGADTSRVIGTSYERETSPHAWSRLSHIPRPGDAGRNISTCVEQTPARRTESRYVRKHLHMRGADVIQFGETLREEETSPHAWSRQDTADIDPVCARNISTCVEQTSP